MVLLRHGATEWSLSGQHTGRTDIPLLDLGREQARAAGELLRGMNFAQVLTSPLLRARETAALAGFDGEIEPDLLEWDYGAYEGLTSEEIRDERPGWTLWTDGVVDGEGAADVGRRVDRVIERARSAQGDTLCVAHGHVLRVLAARWLGLPPVGGRLFALGTGTVSILGWERDAPVITLWNEGAAAAMVRETVVAPDVGGGGARAPRLGADGHVAPGPRHHVGQAERLEVGADRLAHVRPHGQQDALALVVAGAVGVGLPEVAGGDGPVHGGDDLGQADLLGQAGQDIATPDAPFRAHQARSLEGEEDLLEIRLGQRRPLGDVPHRGGILAPVQRQGQQRAAGVVATCRDSHTAMLPGGWSGAGCFRAVV